MPWRWAIAAAMAVSCVARAAEDVVVKASRDGDAIRVTARATIHAPLPLVWETLTDYDRLALFIPGMRRSRTVDHRGAAAIVEQRGEARLLMFSYPINVTVASVHVPPYVIEIHLLKGNLRRLDGAYRIEPLPRGGVVLHWSGLIEPDLPMPPIISEYLMRASLGDQFRAMVREIDRRASLHHAD